MPKRDINYPHRVSYRVDVDTWARLDKAIAGSGLSPHDWCRQAALEKLDQTHEAPASQRLLLEQFGRYEYLLAKGFQLLASQKLNVEEWNKLRSLAAQNGAEFADRLLIKHARTNDNNLLKE